MSNTHNASERTQRFRVGAATMIGSTIEWYDFFIFATAASLVFAGSYFEPAGSQIGILLSLATVGVSFFFRPLGAFLAGHFGDRLGRRKMLVLTLLLMGASTTLVGLLPTFDAIGLWAPILLVTLRILQGISAGGEWGGAALMAVEHAPVERRGIMGSLPQLGVPLGLLLAAGVTAVMTRIAPGDAFDAWGWRVPFLLSIVLVAVGYFVRRAVEESPVFKAMSQDSVKRKAPISVVLKHYLPLVALAALMFAGNNAAGYLTTGGFVTNYVTDTSNGLGVERTTILNIITLAGVFYLLSTLLGGFLADRIGRRMTTLLGFILQLVFTLPFIWMISDGNVALLGIGACLWYLVNGLTYGPQAAWYAEMFPASIRYTGVSLSYALGAILGGAFAPMISTALVQRFGISAVGVYILAITVIALVATILLRDRQGINLGPENEEEQAHGATSFGRRTPLPEPAIR